MTSSSPETSMHSSGAPRAPQRAPREAAHRPPARYEPYLDGLFTYCLSVLCDHDAAMAVLGDVLSIAERQYGRSPSAEGERKAWLYALARWACLRRLTEQRRGRRPAHTGAASTPAYRSAGAVPSPTPSPEALGAVSVSGSASVGAAEPTGSAGSTACADPATAERHRRELALLAWPEAAGTTPEQREILELAVRHQLGPRGVAAVLAMELTTARELLASAACEVERTRAALAVVETGTCPAVARLTSDSEVLLSATLRRELVRHVDDCPRCRRTAERVEAAGPWPGAGSARPRAGQRAPAVLPLVEADRTAAYAAMVRAPRARATAPRFGRNGFPLDPKDRAARRDRLRARAVTTTVVATVIAAPVLALWAAYRDAPETGEGHDGPAITADDGAGRFDRDEGTYGRYENAGNASTRRGAHPGDSAVSVKVISTGTPRPARPGQPPSGSLTVTAEVSNGVTTITLTASGGPVSWAASPGANWLRLSRTSGTLGSGRSVTIQVSVDHAREPAGPWSARIALHPTGAVVRVQGYGGTETSAPPPSHVRPGKHHGHHGDGRGRPRPGHGGGSGSQEPPPPASPPPDQSPPPTGGSDPTPPPEQSPPDTPTTPPAPPPTTPATA